MMKNKIFAFMAVIVLCFTMIIPVSATQVHIFDPAGMFGDVDTLESYAQKIEETYDFSVLVSVVDTVGDEGTFAYCEDLYVANADKENGVALTYNYGDNKYAVYCSGEAKTLFPEDVQSDVLWNAFAYTETYFDGAYAYFKAVEDILITAYGTQDAENTGEILSGNENTLPLVVDNADVLTDAEEAAFTARLEALGEKYELEIAILTVDTYDGKDGQAYADDFYDYNGYGYGENDDGLMIVFNTGLEGDKRNITLTTHGTAIDYISDMERDVIFEMMIPYLTDGNYAMAFECFVNEADSSIDPSVPVYYIPLSIVIGFAVAFIVVKIQASKLKTVIQKADASDYVGNVMLTGEYDNFMYRDLRKTPRAKESSSTHTSSSGRTHGGGSRDF